MVFKATLNLLEQLNLRNDFKGSFPFNLTNVPKYEESPDVFDSFVAKYGTHFFASATFGRKLSVKLAINQAFLKKIIDKKLLKKLTATFTRRLYNSTDGFLMDPFLKQNCEVLSDGFTKPWNLTEWTSGVIKNSFPLFGTLKPINELISIPEIKAEVAKAISLKLAKAYLAQLKHLVKKGNLQLTANDTEIISNATSVFHPHSCQYIPELVEQLDTIVTRLVSPAVLGRFNGDKENAIPLPIAIVLCIALLFLSAGFVLKGYFLVQACLNQKSSN